MENLSRSIELQYGIFLVGDKLYCLWADDIQGLTLEFIDGIDPTYFSYLAETHFSNLDDLHYNQKQNAALSLRNSYSQALETFFALLMASIQAPNCISAWMSLYKNSDLNNLVENIENYKPVMSRLINLHPNWEFLANIIHENLVLEDKGKEQAIKIGFGNIWSHFASQFTNQEFRKEYNSIKHGLRVRSGGFSFSIGREETPGDPESPRKMHLLGSSEYGTSYYSLEQIGGLKNHFQLASNSQNWDPEDMAWGLHLLSMSINNIISFIKVMNGKKPEDVKFIWPDTMQAFQEPWKRSRKIGITSVSRLGNKIPEEFVDKFSDDEMFTKYQGDRVIGIKRIIFE